MAKNINLDSMSVEDLNELIQEAQAKRDEKLKNAKQAFIEEMTSRAAALGVSLEGLLGGQKTKTGTSDKTRKPRKDAGSPVPVKFRGPGGEEWTGRGRSPNWLSALEASGKNREEFQI